MARKPFDPAAPYRFTMWFVFEDEESEEEQEAETVIKTFRFIGLTEDQLNMIMWWADHGREAEYMEFIDDLQWTFGKLAINADQLTEVDGYDTVEVKRDQMDAFMARWVEHYAALGLVLSDVETMTEDQYQAAYGGDAA